VRMAAYDVGIRAASPLVLYTEPLHSKASSCTATSPLVCTSPA